MKLSPEFLDSYRWQRQLSRVPFGLGLAVTASDATALARADVANGKRRYPSPVGGYAAGAPFGGSDRLRWLEQPGAAGFRFVGFADEVAPDSIQHTGWFTDPHGDGNTIRGAVYQLPASHGDGNTIRGAVYQLPASRDGRPRYVAGYQEGSTTRAGWENCNPDSAVIAVGEIFAGEPGGEESGRRVGGKTYLSDHYGAHREAARRADSIAERIAESEREYQEAWQAGSQWQAAGEAIGTARRAALRLLAEMRAAGRRLTDPASSPAICGALRDRVESLVEEIRAEREKRAEIKPSGWWRPELCDAWRDGAGLAEATAGDYCN